MNRRYELPRREAQEDAGGEIVFPYAVAELEVGLEHCAEGEGYGLVEC